MDDIEEDNGSSSMMREENLTAASSGGKRSDENSDPVVVPQLPFEKARTDLLIGNGSRLDIENVNLLATLLVHAQHNGYWSKLGDEFEEEMSSLLDRHLLAGLTSARACLQLRRMIAQAR